MFIVAWIVIRARILPGHFGSRAEGRILLLALNALFLPFIVFHNTGTSSIGRQVVQPEELLGTSLTSVAPFAFPFYCGSICLPKPPGVASKSAK